jgi:hypothetical protein
MILAALLRQVSVIVRLLFLGASVRQAMRYGMQDLRIYPALNAGW